MANINPAQLQKYLGGIDYPCSKQSLVSHAKDTGADDTILTTLQNLPGDSYSSASDVSEAIGKLRW